MLRAFIIVVGLGISGLVVADPRSSEGNSAEELDVHTRICLAAMESKEAAKALAIELDVSRRELVRIRCNELSVMEFAQQHSETAEDWTIATVQ